MELISCFVITSFFGLIGILFKKNFLGIIASYLQFILGAGGIFFLTSAKASDSAFLLLMIAAQIIGFLVFLFALSTIVIRRRSTLQVNELTELRG